MKKNLMIAGIFLFLLGGMYFFGAHSSLPKAAAEKDLSEEAHIWMDSIRKGSEDWKKFKNAADTAEEERMKTGMTVAGLRISLCSKYGIVVDEKGQSQTVADRKECATFQ